MSIVLFLQIGMSRHFYEPAATVVFSQEFVDRPNHSIRIALQGYAGVELRGCHSAHSGILPRLSARQWNNLDIAVNRYLSKSVNSCFISLRAPVHKVSTKISQDCPTNDRSQR